MYSQLFVEMESFQFTKTGQAACGDDIQIKVLKDENRYLAVLSDGLGSGVKAAGSGKQREKRLVRGKVTVTRKAFHHIRGEKTRCAVEILAVCIGHEVVLQHDLAK